MTDQMTRDEAINQARYQTALWCREETLFARLQRTIQSIQLASGLAAVATFADSAPKWLTITCGAIIAGTVVVDFVFRPGEAASRARSNSAYWSKVHTQVHSAAEPDLRQMIHEGWERPDKCQGSLRPVAYNDMLDERGYPTGHYQLNAWQTLLKLLS